MTCQDFWDTMPELAEGPGGESLAHLRQCPACAAVLERQRALHSGLRAVAADSGRVKAPGRVEARLLAEFRGQAGLVAPPPARRWWTPLAAWGTAALVVAAAVVLFVVRARQPQTPPAPAAVTQLASVDWTAGLPLDENEAGGEFVTLPNADRLPPNEHLNLVRVEVPRSAMIALGYAVSADRAQERVRADVVLGSDGLARAVRFLQ